MALDIQLNNFSKDPFLIKKCMNELVDITNSGLYHMILFNGICECELNFESYSIKKNCILFLNPSDVFFCENKQSEISHYSFGREVFAKEHCETETFINGLLFNNLLSDPFLKLSAKEFLNFESNIKSNFRKIITQSIIRKQEHHFSESLISKNHQIAYRYFSLINENFRMEHNVFIYAQILRIQPKILTKIFFDLKIENPKSYLNKRILIAIKKMLIYNSDKSIEISYEVGFDDPAYFARFFKKNTGLTPKEFRQNQRVLKSVN
jgi:AraC family transcriptional activator of pobA